MVATIELAGARSSPSKDWKLKYSVVFIFWIKSMQKTKASVRDESAHINYKQMSEIFDPRGMTQKITIFWWMGFLGNNLRAAGSTALPRQRWKIHRKSTWSSYILSRDVWKVEIWELNSWHQILFEGHLSIFWQIFQFWTFGKFWQVCWGVKGTSGTLVRNGREDIRAHPNIFRNNTPCSRKWHV